MKGVLITFEGIEGCGKTTHAKMLFEYLHNRGYRVFITREPGGTLLGKRIRELVLSTQYQGITHLSELFLYLADRAQHLETVIKPHLEDGGIVICDRFADSTYVYQGFGRKIDREFIKKANSMATQKIMPDKTFVFDIDIVSGLKRSAILHKENAAAGTLDRIEGEAAQFHEKIRSGFKSLVRSEGKRCVLIDGTGDMQKNHKKVAEKVNELLKKKKLFRFDK